MSRTPLLCFSVLLLSCGGGTEAEPIVIPDLPPQLEFLDATDHLTRASLALRARRPSPSDLGAVQQDPSVVGSIIDGYLTSSAFGEMIRDLHAEALLMRSERIVLPSMGPLFGIE